MFPLSKFRLRFPVFNAMPDEVVADTADWALCYAKSRACGCGSQLWMLLTAHLLELRRRELAGQGAAPGAVTSATIDKVSVSFQAPASKDAWSHWLSLTPFGQEYLALMKSCGAGGMYVGGLPERAAFRSVGGLSVRGGRFR